MAVGKSAFKIRLDLHSAAWHIPGAVVPLRFHEELHAALQSRVCRWNSELAKRVEHLPRCIGVARKMWGLRPSSVRTLKAFQSLNARFLQTRIRIGPMKSQQLHDAILCGQFAATFKVYNTVSARRLC